MKKAGYIIAVVFMGLILFSPNFVCAQTDAVGGTKEEVDALNQQIADHKAKIKEMEDTMAQYQKTIDQKQTEAVSLKNTLAILDNRLAQMQLDIEMTKQKINQAQLEIDALDLTIKEKETIIARQKNIIVKIVQSIYVEDQKNYLEIALTNDSFADFYNQAKYLENVYTDLGQSVHNFRLAKEDLQAKQAQVQKRQELYAKLNDDLQNKYKDLTDQSNAKTKLLTDTHASELRYRTLLASMRAQYQSIENEMQAYEDQVRKKLEEQDKIPTDGSIELSWPLNSRYITAAFHDPDYPFQNIFAHSGIDIRASQGTPVKAAASGYVARAKHCTTASCYSYILIVHTGNISTVYGHLSQISVSEDQFVQRGDVIGYSGGTPGAVGSGPFVTGAHLHFEVRANGIPVDPMGYLIQA